MEASFVQPNLLATILSPVVASGQACLQFWYHMYGPDVATLKVSTTINNQDTLLWQRSGSQGDQWRSGMVQINPSSTYQVNSINIFL